MAVREEPLLEFHCKQMDHFVGLQFSQNFHFALMVHLVKGMGLLAWSLVWSRLVTIRECL